MGPDVLVGLCDRALARLVVGILGILKAGGAYLPLDPAYPRERLAFMLEDAGVARRRHGARVRAPTSTAARATLVLLDAKPRTSALRADADVRRRPGDLAYVIYTSGSTGHAQGRAASPTRNVTRLFDATDAWFASTSDDVWTLFHSYAFDFSVWELWGALLYGGRLVVVPYWVSRSPEAFRELLAARGRDGAQPDAVGVPPAHRRPTVASPDAAERACATSIFGGEALELAEPAALVRAHGDARAAARQHVRHHRDDRARDLPADRARPTSTPAGSVIGVPIPDLASTCWIATASRCRSASPGEMYVGGAGVSRAATSNRPELTAERFVPDPFAATPARGCTAPATSRRACATATSSTSAASTTR